MFVAFFIINVGDLCQLYSGMHIEYINYKNKITSVIQVSLLFRKVVRYIIIEGSGTLSEMLL